jgi:hypothetical protein
MPMFLIIFYFIAKKRNIRMLTISLVMNFIGIYVAGTSALLSIYLPKDCYTTFSYNSNFITSTTIQYQNLCSFDFNRAQIALEFIIELCSLAFCFIVIYFKKLHE